MVLSRFFHAGLLSFFVVTWALQVPSLTAFAQAPATAEASITYPSTQTVDVVDEYHGRKIKDPFRWLEDTESAETAAWVKAQNEVTQEYLQSIPERAAMRDRLEELWNYERYGLPRRRGATYFYTHNDGLQNQSVLYKATSLDAQRQLLIDPNTLSEDGTVALKGEVGPFGFDPDGLAAWLEERFPEIAETAG